MDNNLVGTYAISQYYIGRTATSDSEWEKILANLEYEDAEPTEYLLQMISLASNEPRDTGEVFDSAEDLIGWLNNNEAEETE